MSSASNFHGANCTTAQLCVLRGTMWQCVLQQPDMSQSVAVTSPESEQVGKPVDAEPQLGMARHMRANNIFKNSNDRSCSSRLADSQGNYTPLSCSPAEDRRRPDRTR